MTQYMLLLHQAPNYNMDLPREKMMEMTRRYMAWADGLRQKGKLVGGEKLAAGGGAPHQGQGRQAGRQRRPLCRGQGRDRRLLRDRGQGSRRSRGDRPRLPASRLSATNWVEIRPIEDMAPGPRGRGLNVPAIGTGPPARRFAGPRFGEPPGRRAGAAAGRGPHRRRRGCRPARAAAGAVVVALQGRAGQARSLAGRRRPEPRARPAAHEARGAGAGRRAGAARAARARRAKATSIAS